MDQTKTLIQLQELGLTAKESCVYLSILEHGPLSTTQLSRLTKIPKTNIYRMTENLLIQNLVNKIIGPRGVLFEATSPDYFKTLIDDKINKLSHIQESLPPLLGELKALQNNPKYKTNVRFYEGLDGIKQLIWNSLEADTIIYGYSTLGRAIALGNDFEERVEREYKVRKITDRIIINDSKDTLAYLARAHKPSLHGNINIRIFPEEDFYISNDIMIYNNILSVSTWKDKNYFGFEIENAEVVKTQKSMYNIMWKAAKPLNKYV